MRGVCNTNGGNTPLRPPVRHPARSHAAALPARPQPLTNPPPRRRTVTHPTPATHPWSTSPARAPRPALSLLARYCTSLHTAAAARAGATPPTFTATTWAVRPPGPPFAARLDLPAAAAVRAGCCAAAATVADARRLAALDACARLYAAGGLDEWLLPRDAHLDGLLRWHRR